MGVFQRADTWWYEFWFAGRRIRESAKTNSKTVAKKAEQKRRRELEEGFNDVAARREERVQTVATLATAYLDEYKLKHRAGSFAEYATVRMFSERYSERYKDRKDIRCTVWRS